LQCGDRIQGVLAVRRIHDAVLVLEQGAYSGQFFLQVL
jgi:hypothetical protein